MGEEKKEFSGALFGYNKAEVDAYISELHEQYDALAKEKEELETKMSDAEDALLDLIKLNTSVENAKKQSNEMIQKAYEDADKILFTAKTNCETVLKNFYAKIEEQQKLYIEMKNKVASFKDELFEKYKIHIELIDKLCTEEKEDETLTADEYAQKVITSVKRAIYTEYNLSTKQVSESTPDSIKNPEPAVKKEQKEEKVLNVETQPGGEEKYVPLDEDAASVTQETKARTVMEMLSEYEKQESKKFASEDGIQLALDIDAGIPEVKEEGE